MSHRCFMIGFLLGVCIIPFVGVDPRVGDPHWHRGPATTERFPTRLGRTGESRRQACLINLLA
jgi:hypothetical protein